MNSETENQPGGSSPSAALRDQIARGCSEEEFHKMRCPVCSASLSIHVHPSKTAFFLRCSKNSLHLGIHGETVVGYGWWDKFISGGWYDAKKE